MKSQQNPTDAPESGNVCPRKAQATLSPSNGFYLRVKGKVSSFHSLPWGQDLHFPGPRVEENWRWGRGGHRRDIPGHGACL